MSSSDNVNHNGRNQARVDTALDQARIGLALMLEADEKGDTAEFKTQALHLAEHFSDLDNAVTDGSALPAQWRKLSHSS